MADAAAEARVDLDAIRSNVGVLAGRARNAQVMAVVKANGYGHGMVPVARAALEGGATWLGTATIAEALTLRAAGIRCPILSWLTVPGSDWRGAVAAGVDLSAADTATVDAIATAAGQAGQRARLHLEVDSGLHRGGASCADWPELVRAALEAESSGLVTVVGLWSHLGSSDDPHGASTCRQLDSFGDALAVAERLGARPEVRHLANSAATLLLPATHFDLVRPGIAVYGLWPDQALDRTELRPAMTLLGRLASVKSVAAGQGVSYGHDYVTPAQTRLGLVPLGYADGIPRRAGSRMPVLVDGQRRCIVGRVCMDQVVVDLGGTEASTGDEVVVFGPGDDGEPTVNEWAACLGTIAQDILTGVGERVVRSYR